MCNELLTQKRNKHQWRCSNLLVFKLYFVLNFDQQTHSLSPSLVFVTVELHPGKKKINLGSFHVRRKGKGKQETKQT